MAVISEWACSMLGLRTFLKENFIHPDYFLPLYHVCNVNIIIILMAYWGISPAWPPPSETLCQQLEMNLNCMVMLQLHFLVHDVYCFIGSWLTSQIVSC